MTDEAGKAEGRTQPAKARGRKAKTVRDVVAAAQGRLDSLTVSELQSAKRFQELQRDIKADIEAVLGDKYTFRRTELATIFSVEERTINRWSKKGLLPQSSRGAWDIRDILKNLHDQLEGVSRDGTPDDRLKTVKALREEHKLKQEKAQVIDRDTFTREASVRLTAARDRASGWAERFVRLFPADQRNQALVQIRSEVRDFLRMISGALLAPKDTK